MVSNHLKICASQNGTSPKVRENRHLDRDGKRIKWETHHLMFNVPQPFEMVFWQQVRYLKWSFAFPENNAFFASANKSKLPQKQRIASLCHHFSEAFAGSFSEVDTGGTWCKWCHFNCIYVFMWKTFINNLSRADRRDEDEDEDDDVLAEWSSLENKSLDLLLPVHI